ncbi:unnamed protein product, partial [Didymodactylos carnosus]
YSNTLFLMTSDDKNYCNSMFGNMSNVIITPKSFSPELDLAALVVCQHTIVTSGSFGWWAAFLTNGDVVYDKANPAPGSGLENDCPRISYYPPWYISLKN